MNNTIITIIVLVGLIVADFIVRIYLKKKDVANATTEEKSETNEEILKDFLSIMQSISTQVLELINVDTNVISKEAYESLLARKILTTFKETVVPHYTGTTLEVIINSLPEEFILEWIKKNVLTLDDVATKIEAKIEEKSQDTTTKIEGSVEPEQVNIIDEIIKE